MNFTELALPGLFFLILLWGLEPLFPFAQMPAQRLRHALPNAILYAMKIAIQLSFSVGTFFLLDFFELKKIGLLYLFEMPLWLRFILGFLLFDFGNYALHRISHKFSFLWKFHSVHHTDTEVDVTTYLRTHPVEAVFAWCWLIMVTGFFGIPKSVVFFSMGMTLFFALFQHANIRVPLWLEKAMSLFVLSPMLHKIHHSNFISETDSNYGTFLVFWDKLFGTYCKKEDFSELQYGLEKLQKENPLSVSELLLFPWKNRD
jgi:sterol desaturase/sphingolipid hydroxylase (fatty acid hydroxylase superfamily)